eukprot:1160793-Pelagomonas_calceolata.AAC.7
MQQACDFSLHLYPILRCKRGTGAHLPEGLGPTCPPKALASAWWPRQQPTCFVPGYNQSVNNLFERAVKGCKQLTLAK